MKNYIDSFMRYRFLLVELVKKGIKLKMELLEGKEVAENLQKNFIERIEKMHETQWNVPRH